MSVKTMDINILRQAYIDTGKKVNRQRDEINKMRETIEQLKEENKELREYKKAYYTLRVAGVDVPFIKS